MLIIVNRASLGSVKNSVRFGLGLVGQIFPASLKQFFTAGTFEVNYMDDVGQTLLNWASAFGTLEMVCVYF